MIGNLARNGSAVTEDARPDEQPVTHVDELIAMAEQAEADADEAEAHAAAVSARARAIRARQRLQEVDITEASEIEPESPGPSKRPWYRRLRRPSRTEALRAAAVLIVIAALAASGLVLWRHQQAVDERQRADEFAAAAREGVMALTSLDFARAKEDVQRVLDNATGAFKTDFEKRAEDFGTIVEDSKVVAQGNVYATAVESMTRDSAVVLVAATSEVTNSAGAKDKPRAWRLEVTVTRDGDRLKMSKVEFVQ